MLTHTEAASRRFLTLDIVERAPERLGHLALHVKDLLHGSSMLVQALVPRNCAALDQQLKTREMAVLLHAISTNLVYAISSDSLMDTP